MTAFEQLQYDVAARLNSLAYFVDVPVIVLRPLDTATSTSTGEIAQDEFWRVKKDGTKSGVGVLVPPATWNVPYPNVPGPQWQPRLTLRVVEQPLVSEASDGLNPSRAGKSAEAVAREVARGLHQWSPNGQTQCWADGDAVRPDAQDKRLRAYAVTVKLLEWPEEEPSKTANPSIAIGSGTCTITASEGSAYYTTDGSAPTSENGGTLYTAPFAVTTGTQVRACAFATGKYGSDFMQETA